MKRNKECRKISAKLNSFIDDELSAKERAFIEEHLNGCTACKTEYESLAALNGSLAILRNPECPESLKNRLKSIPGSKTAAIKHLRLLHYLKPLPVAAAILLTIAAAGFLGNNIEVGQQTAESESSDYLLHRESLYTVLQEVYDE